MEALQTKSKFDVFADFYTMSCVGDASETPVLTPMTAELQAKNRWTNIIPVDATRVRLRARPGGTDYINANFIHLGDVRYIATQAPLSNTTDDFWQMCWEQDCRVIVMLCNLTEQKKIRCHRYWPVKVGEECQYGGGVVRLLKTATLPGLQLRRFQLTCSAGVKVITQLHYTEWPDFGVPDDTEAVRCIAEMFDYYTRGGGTGVVHCSAGIGRTGTFIAIHACLRELMRVGRCDVRAAVTTMRRCRLGMVQTQEQYLFIHVALRDAQDRFRSQEQLSRSQEAIELEHEQAAQLRTGLTKTDWEVVRLNMSAADLQVDASKVQ